jgi:hypothetical protein
MLLGTFALAAAILAQPPVLTLSISAPAGSFDLGDEIPITFAVTNGGADTYEYSDRNYDRSGRMGEYQLAATREGSGPAADPRARNSRGYIGGGLSGFGKLAPGASFTRTIPLNLWALLDAPGRYTVTGRYVTERSGVVVQARPIVVVVRERSPDALGRYVSGLGAALAASKTAENRDRLVQRLAFTRDVRAVPFLLDAMAAGGNQSFWAAEAFAYYLPRTPDVTGQVIARARDRGLADGTIGVLEDLNADAEVVRALIAASLEPARRGSWYAAAAAAQRVGDDRFMARLIAIASSEDSGDARIPAMYAVAMHRTDEGVAALARWLADPDPKIRDRAADAIRIAYHSRGVAQGRALRPEDFPALAKR